MARSSQVGSSFLPLAGIVVLVAAAGVFYYSFRKAETPEVVAPAPTPEAKPEPPKEAVPATAPATVRAEPKPAGSEMVYPDGSRFPNLNGVEVSPVIGWPKDRPFSPVSGTTKDAQGVEWYTHVDGSFTTVMIDRGSKKPVALVYNPTKVVPIADDDQKMLEEQKKRQQPQASGKQ